MKRIDDKAFVRQMPCLLCGQHPSDAHHWPVRRSHGAGDSMYEMVPLCRLCHDDIHRGDVFKINQLNSIGPMHHAYLKEIS